MSKVNMMSAKDKKKGSLVPRLRFPEFRDAGEWEKKKLDAICSRILQKVSNNSLTPVSITAGQGFVSQESKFGRNIAGEQYKNYIFLEHGDFAYNKGNSKKYPQGYVCQLKEFQKAAASSAFLCFRFVGQYEASFFQSLFDNNIHGKQLASHITSSARSDGLLNIKPDTFFSILLPVPRIFSEQQKIADCLSSLDERIAAETNKLDALKAHKKGLLKQLFPAEGETLPQLRFPEFQDAGEWGQTPLGELLLSQPDYGVNAPAVPYTSSLPTYIRITDISAEGQFIVENKASVDIVATHENCLHPGDIVLARTGASVGKAYKYNESDGKLVFAGFLIRVKPNWRKINSNFLFNFLFTKRYWDWVAFTSPRSGQPGINSAEYASLPVPTPPSDGDTHREQQKIAVCFSSLDELIIAQTQKIELLKSHKKGLMQQLFPVHDEAKA